MMPRVRSARIVLLICCSHEQQRKGSAVPETKRFSCWRRGGPPKCLRVGSPLKPPLPEVSPSGDLVRLGDRWANHCPSFCWGITDMGESFSLYAPSEAEGRAPL